jgi:hypothetical protein
MYRFCLCSDVKYEIVFFREREFPLSEAAIARYSDIARRYNETKEVYGAKLQIKIPRISGAEYDLQCSFTVNFIKAINSLTQMVCGFKIAIEINPYVFKNRRSIIIVLGIASH